MEELVLLLNMTMLLLIGGICSIIFKRLKMPAAIGYIVSGIILSNYWAGESTDTQAIVSLLSDLGLVLMMFGIGMELNLKKLRKMGTFATMVVMIQVPVMLAGGYLGATIMGLTPLAAIVFGAIISGSSTAVITIVLAEQDRISHADVETLILVTVIEDVAQVLIMSAVTPLINGQGMDVVGIIMMLIVVIIFMALTIFVGLLFIPKLLDYIGKQYSDEILLVISLGLCFGLAYISVTIGMSMAIGAFMMGVIISQSKTHVAIGHEVEPMKNVFMMMFFISIGLLIDPMDIVRNIGTILIIYLIYFVLKGGSVILAYFVGNKPMRLSFYCSISLIAMGEFAFIISKEAYQGGVISSDFYASVIGAALVSMIVLPMINRKAEKICDFMQVRTPQPIVNGFMKIEVLRSNFYTKMSMATKETMANFRSRLAYVYASFIAVVIIQIIFIIATPAMSEVIFEHTPESISMYVTIAIVMLLNFLALIPFLRKATRSVKYLFRVYMDSVRKALAAGKGKPHKASTNTIKFMLGINDWVYVFMSNFLIIMFTPFGIDFWGRLIVTAIGIIVVSLVQVAMLMRRS